MGVDKVLIWHDASLDHPIHPVLHAKEDLHYNNEIELVRTSVSSADIDVMAAVAGGRSGEADHEWQETEESWMLHFAVMVLSCSRLLFVLPA